MTAGFTAAFSQAQTRISTHMEHRLPQTDLLHQAMLYALRGGKMLRGFLVLESARLHDVPETAALEAALAI